MIEMIDMPVFHSEAYEARPWGFFNVLRNEKDYKLKTLTVKPGHQMSLQCHAERDEHWIVVRGEPTFMYEGRAIEAKCGDYMFVPRMKKHRIANFTNEDVEIIEVQQGDRLSEDDITRFEDDYNRV